MDIKQRFGQRVRERRVAVGISQEELAMRINAYETGDDKGKYADQSYISKIELGHANITLETIEALANALKTEPHELLMEE